MPQRSETGRKGVELVCEELAKHGYKAVTMPNHKPGFDIECRSPKGNVFKVEVKCSTSIGTQIPLQVKSHLEAPLQRDRLYILMRLPQSLALPPEFCVMTHEEIQAAWALMPKFKPNGQPYVIGPTGYIDWKHITPHRDKWEKMPE